MKPDLSFKSLEFQVQLHLPDEPLQLAAGMWPWAWWIGWIGAACALVTVHAWEWLGIPAETALRLVIFGLCAEIGGFLIAILIPALRAIPRLKDRRREYAEELDKANGQVGVVLAWLRQFPAEQRAQLLKFSETLRERMTWRMNLVFGGLERLGLLPVLLAVYFQVKDIQGGMQNALDAMNRGAAAILLFVAALYIVGWLVLRYRSQLSGYAELLALSLEPVCGTKGDLTRSP